MTLPPAPRPTSQRPPSAPRTTPDLHQMQQNYLKMLSQPDNTPPGIESMAPSATMSHNNDDYQAPMPSAPYSLDSWEPLMDSAHTVLTTPLSEYHPTPMSEMFDEFPQLGASPGEDTPFNDFLNTPVIPENQDFGVGFDPSAPLFGGMEPWVDQSSSSGPTKESDRESLAYFEQLFSPPVQVSDTFAPPTQHSPSTSAQLATPNTSPALLDSSSFAPPMLRPAPTGTRPGVTPDKLLGPDAPTQPRKYIAPSSTSRKEAPAAFNRGSKRSRAAAFQDDDEELPPLPANATDAEQVEYKRRQNTLAARKSRRRKLEHQLVTERKADYFQRRSNHFETVARTVIAMWQEQTGRPYELPAFPDPEP
ncbi:hypothetical protein HDZ31DRAFT_42822 [Schizophyllum fasciatum]